VATLIVVSYMAAGSIVCTLDVSKNRLIIVLYVTYNLMMSEF